MPIGTEGASVIVYIADASPLNDDGLFGRIYDSVPDERRRKADGLKYRKDKNLSLGAAYLKMQACKKPYYNLSHSGETVICAASDFPVGCDVEQIRDVSPHIASRFFRAEESEWIESQKDEKAARETFFRIWVLKESFMKCTRLGFALPFNAFSVLPNGDEILLRQSVDPAEYVFYEHTCGDGYRYACCVRDGKNRKIRWEHVTISPDSVRAI